MSITTSLMEEEKNALAAMLAPYLSAEERKVYEKVLTKEDLDRTAAEAADVKTVMDVLETGDLTGIATACRKIHEDQRVRRDIHISRASHKRLLYGGIRTAWQRKKYLLALLEK